MVIYNLYKLNKKTYLDSYKKNKKLFLPFRSFLLSIPAYLGLVFEIFFFD